MAQAPTEETKDVPKDEQKDSSNNESSAKDPSSSLHRAVVGGATGSIGRYVVYLLVRDPRVESVMALTRSSPRDPEFYGLDAKKDPVSKLKHLIVDYTKDIYEQFTAAKLTFTIGFSAIGVYTSDVKNTDDFMAKEYEPNLKLGKAAAQCGVTSYGYLSGSGVKITEKKGRLQAAFSWVKGCVERDLTKIEELKYVGTFRPAGIVGRPADKKLGGLYGWFEKKQEKNPDKWAKNKMFVHRDDIGRAMVNCVIIQDNNNGKYKNKGINKNFNITIFENQDIKDKAAQYLNELKTLLPDTAITTTQETTEKKEDGKTNDDEKETEKEKEKEKENGGGGKEEAASEEKVVDKPKDDNGDENKKEDGGAPVEAQEQDDKTQNNDSGDKVEDEQASNADGGDGDGDAAQAE